MNVELVLIVHDVGFRVVTTLPKTHLTKHKHVVTVTRRGYNENSPLK